TADRAAGPVRMLLTNDAAPVTLIGTVTSDPRPQKYGGLASWELKVQAVGERGSSARPVNAYVWVTGEPLPYRSQVQVTGRLTLEPNPGQRIARLQAETTGVLHPPAPWWRLANTLRAGLLELSAALPGAGATLLPGMAIGDTSRLSPEVDQAFRTTGLAHLTAVSGGHFAILLAGVGSLAASFSIPKWPRIFVMTLVSAWFVMLVRPGGAVTRAAAMCAVSLTAALLGRKSAAIPALGAAIVVLIIWNPWLARSYGFALSCSASATLALFSAPLAKRLTPWLGKKFAYLVAVPIAAQVGCLPILLLFTTGLPTTVVLANLLALPMVAPATLLGLIATVLAPWAHPVAWVVARAASWACAWIVWAANFCARLPLAVLPWPGGGWGVALALALLAGAVCLVSRWQPRGWPQHWRETVSDTRKQTRRRVHASYRRYELGIPNHHDRRWALASLGVVILIAFLGGLVVPRLLWSRRAYLADWQVVACDVGQGDGLVIRSGPRSAVVIDTGNDDGAMARCLAQLRIKNIDLLVLSHYHSDHAGGLAAVARRFPIAAALGPDHCDGGALAVLESVDTLVVQVPAVGEMGRAGSVEWLALGAGSADPVGLTCEVGDVGFGYVPGGANDSSLVVAIRISGAGEPFVIVALGDTEATGQGRVLSQLTQLGIAADGVDLVKVAHHGSANQSPALVEYLRPQAAVFSVGVGNGYGHPTAAALELYASVGADLVRTDECGMASFAKRDGNLVHRCAR
ncbi:MAG: ComEC/Rec2 family competence protein, partial [Promicromonosporaceae bacterium]|nr:ComEC/Rec2 family competence protein [Promicromonosporaceae bacterium]